jgi:hypothetical protein
MEERIQARLTKLKQGRDDHVRDANVTLEQFNAAIGELEALLRPETPQETETDPATTQEDT